MMMNLMIHQKLVYPLLKLANGEPLYCVANVDYAAKSDSELMFIAGETILVLKKLTNGFYLVYVFLL